MTLTELYNSDSYLNSSDKGTVHSYIEHFYELEFEKYRSKDVSILEVGTYKGASLALYKAFFNNATVTGIDGNDWVLPENRHPEISYIVVETAYCKKVADTLGQFDIIIDDGSHEMHHQLSFIEFYLPKLKQGGVFIIEDVGNYGSDINTLKERIPSNYQVEIVDLREKKGRYDDLLLVARLP